MNSTEQIKVIAIRTSESKAAEFYRLCRERHGRSGQQQGERILTDWIAAEQAAEAADAAKGQAA